MNSRERMYAAYQRRPVDRTPIGVLLFQKQFLEKLATEYGPREQFLDEFNVDVFTGFVPYPNQTGKRWTIQEALTLTLEDPRDPKWVNHTDWNYDFAGVNVVEAVAQQGQRRFVYAHLWGIVEGTSTFLGIENCWRSMAEYPAEMTQWFDRYADWLCALLEGVKATGVDAITLSDDWGSNQTMLFSPRMWRRMIGPYAKRVVAQAHALGLIVNLHSDGYIMQIMDDLRDIGYDSLHPLQESAGMDPRTVKDKYGETFILHGSLDVVDGLLTHDGDRLDAYLAERFAIYAPGGGFIFNTGHFVMPDIPPQRLLQAYRTVNALAARYGTGAAA